MGWWAVQPLAQEHRRALAEDFRASRARAEGRSATRMAPPAIARTDLREATVSSRATKPGTARHPVGHHLGKWLIRAGTRLGGATIQAS